MTYKVLSIDLDYIMGPSIETYSNILFDEDPMTRWKHLYEYTQFTESQFYADTSSLIYCYDVFLKALKNCSNVSFGYEHDEILYELQSHKNIDLINIDHHDDIFCNDFDDDFPGGQNLDAEYQALRMFDRVHEGNWGAWLHVKDKLTKFSWITNPNSRNLHLKNDFNYEILGDKYETYTRDNYKFEDYNFDYIFVCLSPQYMPQAHWHYFTMFMMAYETYTGDKVDVNTFAKRKFMQENKFSQVTDAILHKRSNGG